MTDTMTNPTQEVFRTDKAGDVEYVVEEVTYSPEDEYRIIPQSQLDEVIDEGPNHKVIVTGHPSVGLYVIKYTVGKVPEVLQGSYTSRYHARRAYFEWKAARDKALAEKKKK